MVTKDQCIQAGEKGGQFHFGVCGRKVGPLGGIKLRIQVCRVNGKCQTWKRDPFRFRLPVKYGLYGYGEITDKNCENFHLDTECPLIKFEKQMEIPFRKLL